MGVKVPDYVLYEEHTIAIGFHDSIVIPAMTFVKPIELNWVPKHILERWEHKFNPKKDVFVYCSKGFLPVPRNLVKER